MKYGVLVPHFGQHCKRERVVDSAKRIEELGFDGLWVRDHLIFQPHGMEGTDRTFLDAFLTLSAMAAVTKRIALGTAVLIPIRWPLNVAQCFGTLSYLAGGRPIHAGFGIGSNPKELGGAGFDAANREPIFIETLDICRQAWSTGTVNYQGVHFRVDDVTLAPKPTSDISLWYGGTTRAAVRRSVQHCGGWLPGRLPFGTFDACIKYLRELDGASGKKTRIGAIPVVYLDEKSKEAAKSKIDIAALANSSEGSVRWVKPPSGEFRTLEDLAGLIVAGNVDECVEEIAKFAERGTDEFIFDLRLQFDRYEEVLEEIGSALLPKLRKLGI